MGRRTLDKLKTGEKQVRGPGKAASRQQDFAKQGILFWIGTLIYNYIWV